MEKAQTQQTEWAFEERLLLGVRKQGWNKQRKRPSIKHRGKSGSQKPTLFSRAAFLSL